MNKSSEFNILFYSLAEAQPRNLLPLTSILRVLYYINVHQHPLLL